jgi:hypothetical protein
MEQVETKIDKRTKEYKAMIQNPDIVVEGMREPIETRKAAIPTQRAPVETQGPTVEGSVTTVESISGSQNIFSPFDELSPPSSKFDSIAVSARSSVPLVVASPVSPDYHKSAFNPGFTMCSECGGPLEPNDDGTPKFRRQPEACWDCTHKHENDILCKDGVIRNKDACKKVLRKNENGDEVWEWVVK